MMAAHDATTVSIDGEIVAALDRGQFYETVLSQPASIVASQGILLAQFAQSSGVDQTTGDPFLMLVPPYETFGRHYILGTQSFYSYYTDSEIDPYDSYLSVVVDSTHTTEVRVNGQPIAPAEFALIGESGFSGASISVPKDSTIEVSAPVPLGAWIYGWAAYESYGFTGGMYGAIDNATASFQLTQTADAAPLGSVHRVAAALLNPAGLPVQDARVDFSVVGANPITGSGLTAADGTVEFSWQGTQAGIDSVIAACGALSANASVTWVSPGGNQPPQVNAGPDVLARLGEPLGLHGVAQDDGLPAGGSLTLQWSTLPGPGDVTFSDRGSGETTASFVYPGQYTLRLTAYDGQFAGEDDLVVTVDTPPIFTAVYTSSDTVAAGKEWSVAVSAEDRDGLIARIDLIEGDRILATLEPGSQAVFYYQTFLATVFTVPGSHSLTVRLTDDLGASTDRAIDVNVLPAPAVQILTPADQSTVLASDLVAFTASASSPGGSITRVVYSDVTNRDPIEIGDGIGASYLFEWSPDNVGSRRIAATAYDSTGDSTTSVPITIEVQSLGQPTVAIVNPPENSSVYLGQTIAVQADASAIAPAQVVGVDFYDGSRYLGSSYAAPFTANWGPDTLGSHTLTAEVYDSFGQLATASAAVNVTAVPPLAVSFLQPLAGSYLQVSQPTTLVAAIEEIVGTLNDVQFYVNGGPIGDGLSESVTWTPAAVGDYQLQVHASSSAPDQEGDQIITVHVADLHPPVVQWNTPADGASFPTGSVIVLQAQASDTDGNLASFQLQADGELLSETVVSGSGAAANFTWDTAGPGWHSLAAVATDDTNQAGVASIRVFVERPVRSDLYSPTSLTAETLSATGIHLTWILSTSIDSTGTAVERRAGVNGVWQEIAAVDATTTSYDDNALEPEHYYSYRVAALDAAGSRSNYSGESSATTKVQLPRYAVVDLGENLEASFVALNLIDKRFLYAQANGRIPSGALLDLTDAEVMSIDEANNVLLKKRDSTSDGQTTDRILFSVASGRRFARLYRRSEFSRLPPLAKRHRRWRGRSFYQRSIRHRLDLCWIRVLARNWLLPRYNERRAD